MKYNVTQFKSLEVALKELEPFIKNGEHLQSGKPFEKLGGMRSREAHANWLMCVVLNFTGQFELTFSSDPTGGDGVLIDKNTGETWLTEHVMVPRQSGGENVDSHKLVLDAIALKNSRGETYARGKTLVVFMNAEGEQWFPNRVAKAIPDPLHFDVVYVVSFQAVENGEYVYGVTSLQKSNGDAPTFIVRIAKDFDTWSVARQQ